MIGTKLADRYEIVEEIGEGGMGVVYRAHDPALERDVAVKMVPPERLNAKSEARFRREARLVAQMDHRAIVPIHDLGRHVGSLFFVMPLIEGVTLRERIESGDLSPEDAVRIAIEVAEALAHSHARGVVHRDVKPENVMVAREEEELRVRVMDFGLAWESSEQSLPQTGLIGTPSYLSPEQLEGEEVDFRTDLYSLGVTLYECLAGVPPFDGPIPSVIYQIGHDPPPPLSQHGLAAPVDPELEDLVLFCLAKRPGARPVSAHDLAVALRYWLKRTVESGEDGAPAPRPRRVEHPAAKALPMVGREHEWAGLRRHFEAALAGECQLTLVGADAGMGKSRIFQEIEELARARRVRVLRGRYSDLEESLPYEGICDLVRDYFRPGEPWSGPVSEPPQERPDLADLAPELLRLFPIFTEVGELQRPLGGPGGDPGRRAASREADGGTRVLPAADAGSPDAGSPEVTYVFELLARTLIRLSDGKPIVLLLENLHSAIASIEALRYVVHRLGPTPTWIVGSYRPAEIDATHPLRRLLKGLGDNPRASSFVLGPLASGEVERMAAELLGGDLAEGLGERLFEATEGNPLFVQELVRALADSGALRRDGSGRYRLAGETALVESPLPETVQQVVESRLDRLPEAERHVATLAAVLGRDFDYAGLEELYDGADELDGPLDRLLAEGILLEDEKARGDRLCFASALVRDLLYRDLPRRRRRALHRRYAERLEKRSGGTLERVYPQLVHHFSAGDVPGKTVEYGLKQARRALAAASADDALRAARTALEFIEEDEAGERHAAGELLTILARAHRSIGQHRRALQAAERAFEAFAATGDREREVDAALLAAQAAWQGRHVETTRSWVDRGLRAARANLPEGGTGETPRISPPSPQASSEGALRRLLALGSTMANLRGDTRLARDYRGEAERLAPRPKAEAAPDETVPRGGTLRAILPMPVGRLDPAELESDEHAEALCLIYETLLGLDDEGGLVPGLCADWEEADDGRLFHLRLRGGVRFTDGHTLDARDVVASFERLARIRTDAPIPALAGIRGREAFVRGEAETIRGLEVTGTGESPLGLTVSLDEPLPIYPALLTDPYTAIVREDAGGPAPGRPDPGGSALGRPDPARELCGTGPFRLRERGSGRIVLARHDGYWRGTPARLDGVELLTSLLGDEILAGLRDASIDLGRDLTSEDLELVLRDPLLAPGLVETTRKNTYFVLMNSAGPMARHAELRRALFSVVRTSDLVWRTLGRFAQPAACLIPPGILGHDPGRRRSARTTAEAREILNRAGLIPPRGLRRPIRLNAVVHPVLLDRGMALVKALLAEWSALGVEVDFELRSMSSFLAAYESNAEIDLLIGRWNGDYDDPDNYTHTLFDSRHGVLRRYFSSPEADRHLERGRHETSAEARQGCYQRFQDLIEREHVLLPLFHDVAYRIAGPKVRGLRLSTTLPYVNYTTLGKREEAREPPGEPRSWARHGGDLHVPIHSRLEVLDPALGNFTDHVAVVANVYEGLTRVDAEARVVPWLAASFEADAGARRFRFQLRPGVRFHDGRRLTARDVRYSFERLLRHPESTVHFLLLPIRGAQALKSGAATELAGLEIVSSGELTIELEEPLAFFPALLAHPGAAVVPEGTEEIGIHWREGGGGTGAFRIVRFENGVALDLERNPDYWRPGLPKSDRLSFHFGVEPADMLASFKLGRYSLASTLRPRDVAGLRRDPELAAGYHEVPRLSTLFLALNARGGPLADRELRRAFAERLGFDAFFAEIVGRQGTRARGLIPPGLLGYEEPRRAPQVPAPGTATLSGLGLTAVVIPPYLGQYATLFERFLERLGELGVAVELVSSDLPEVEKLSREGAVDLSFCRWVADYPDPDSFVMSLLHSKEGMVSGMCGRPRIDELCERGRRETDPALRHAIYREVEEVLEREALVLPLFHEQNCHFCHPSIEGLRVGFSLPEIPYEELAVKA